MGGGGEEVLLSLKQGGHCRQPLFESGQIGYVGDGNQYLKVRYYLYLRVNLYLKVVKSDTWVHLSTEQFIPYLIRIGFQCTLYKSSLKVVYGFL